MTAVSASNDRFDLLGDMFRRVWVNDSPNIGSNHEDVDVTTTAAEVVATPLTGRKRILIQNRGTAPIYLGNSAGVTAANGIAIPRRTSFESPWGEDLDIFLIAGSGTQDVRILELA